MSESDSASIRRAARQMERSSGAPRHLDVVFFISPEDALPLETALMQMMIHPDAPYQRIQFILKDRVMDMPWNNPVIPHRYTRTPNPCRLSEG